MEAGWDQTFDTPGAAQVCLMRRILAELPWSELIPDQGVFASGVGSERTLNAAMRSRDGSRILVYLSSPTTVFLHLDKIEAKTAKATWISPVTGERKDAGTHATGNRTGATFPAALTQFFKTPDFWEDAVLLLEAVEDQAPKAP
jgi:hypothetical protein